MLSIFLLICFIVSSLTVSCMLSIIKNQSEKMRRHNFGYDEAQCINYGFVLGENGIYDDVKKVLDKLSDKYTIVLNRDIEDDIPKKHDESGEKEIQPSIFYDKKDKPMGINLKSGRMPSPENYYEFVASPDIYDVLGKKEEVEFWGEKFKLVGLCEDDYKNMLIIKASSIDEYFLGNTNFSKMPSFIKFIKEEGNITQEDKNLIFNELKSISSVNKVDEFASDTIVNTTTFAAIHDKKRDLKLNFILIFIAICNIIVVSTFWIIDRKKEIAIRKAFGAEKKHIVMLIYKELSGLMAIAVVISLVLQVIAEKVILKIFKIPISTNFQAFITLMLMGILVVILASIIPIKRALNMEISYCLKE